jgi:predicted ribosomally synthesized peptide with SipW-like signal peptide
MKRIILSLALIVGTIGALLGGTAAFFSDSETSTANVLAAGALDLKVDNESYYNGNVCAEVEPDVWEWQGTATYPVPGTPCTTSWKLDDLDNGHLFFNFTDLKPDDEGEDTISIHAENDAWACMDVTLTVNDDVSSNEPELGDGDVLEDGGNDWDGELAQNIQMFWWADDGDNVYENGEPSISGGVKTLLALAPQNGKFSVALADSANNAWGTPGPMKGGVVSYIAKAWCLGTLVPAPLPDDADTGPQVRGTGFTCDGTLLNNLTQTDSATLDISFSAVQARHNPSFLCTPPTEPETGTLIITKIILGNGGAPEDFSFTVDGGTATPFENDGTNEAVVSAGLHDVVEVAEPGYTTTYTNSQNGNADCNDLNVPPGGNVTCTITNNAGGGGPGGGATTTIVTDNFGTGDCLQNIPGWDEDPGDACPNGTVAAAIGTGDNTASPDGGRFALIGNNGYICRSINATGLENLSISYYWRGDSDADVGDEGLASYFTGGTCAEPTGLSSPGVHPLTTTTWQYNTINLPDTLDNTIFFIRFFAGTNQGSESFRIDGVTLTGTSI